jgi:predicted transposase YdaD
LLYLFTSWDDGCQAPLQTKREALADSTPNIKYILIHLPEDILSYKAVPLDGTSIHRVYYWNSSNKYINCMLASRRRKGSGVLHTHHPYDNSIKNILKEDAAKILPHLLSGVELIDTLDIEVMRSPMRADRVYLVRYKDQPHILHLEFQAGADDEIPYRLLVYHANLLRDYQQYPIITMVIYLFKSRLPTPPLKEMSAEEEILTFHFSIQALWKMDARQYVRQHTIPLYTLLSAMQNADTVTLLEAIQEMVEYYQHDQTKLAERLLWFGTFLKRSDTVSEEVKRKVQDRLDMFEQLLEQNDFVQKQRALGEARGEARGKAEGELQALRGVLLNIVQTRFPKLVEVARKRVDQTGQAATLNQLISSLVIAPDEGHARLLLETLPAGE